ncbi:MAG: hypothetical protein ACODAD_10465 [Planctomycetota bacterium]
MPLATFRRDFHLAAEEGLAELTSPCTTQVTVKGWSVLHNTPNPRPSVQRLLDVAGVTLPKSIVDRGVQVSTTSYPTDPRGMADSRSSPMQLIPPSQDGFVLVSPFCRARAGGLQSRRALAVLRWLVG